MRWRPMAVRLDRAAKKNANKLVVSCKVKRRAYAHVCNERNMSGEDFGFGRCWKRQQLTASSCECKNERKLRQIEFCSWLCMCGWENCPVEVVEFHSSRIRSNGRTGASRIHGQSEKATSTKTLTPTTIELAQHLIFVYGYL